MKNRIIIERSLLFSTIICLLFTGCSKNDVEHNAPSDNDNSVKSSAVIDGNVHYQTIDGFGFSSAWCGRLSYVKNSELYDKLGMSLLRIRIDENKSNWGDEIANSAAAHAAGAKVLGSEWSPPVAWTSNGQSTGGYLLPSHYEDYANYLKTAADSICLDYVSFQNEPDMGYISPKDVVTWSEDQMFAFLKNYSPIIGKPIVYAESFCFNDAYTDPALNDASTVNKIAVVGGHLYGGGLKVHQNALDKGKHVWQTEHYISNSQDSIKNCLKVAQEISDCMNDQMSAYFFWWVCDYINTGINLVNGDGTIYKAGYTAGQFAKWIRPNMIRIGCTYNPIPDIHLTAYNGNGVVIVAVNDSTSSVSQKITFSNITGLNSMKVNRTSENENMDSGEDAVVTNNSFTYTLPAQSITTFHQY